MTPKHSTKGLEFVSCNFCGQEQTTKRFQIPVREDQKGVYGQDIWDLVQCNHCGLIYTNPRPDNEALNAYYTFSNDWDYQFVQDWFIENADLQRPTWRRYLNLIQAQKQTGKLLDIGCGAGTFLVEAQQAGYNVFGQEVAPYFVEYCQNQLDLNIFNGDLSDLTLPNNSYDIITAFDVIEHHPDPDKLLNQMYHLLKPGGLILISTHDIGNFYARLYGDRWRYLNPIGHLTYFSRHTLQAMMKKNNFQPLKTGGLHTVDNNTFIESINKIIQFGRVIVLRSLILGIYKPITKHIPNLTRWQIKFKDATLTHKKLLVRAGNQIIMDDDMVILARVNK